MAHIIYRVGQEKDIILETERYAESIFRAQYDNALQLVSIYTEDICSAMLKSVSFCGERGDGKTSCMMSVLELLVRGSDKNSPQYEYLCSAGFKNLTDRKFEALKLIDPSFFDESHNVIELVVGQMYRKFKDITDTEKYDERNRLATTFQQIKRYLCVLHDRNLDAISAAHELDILSSTIALRSRFEELVRQYLRYTEKDILLIPIDDIDLNCSQAYKMCEQIRKYLAVAGCIVFMAVKVDQLQSIIAENIGANFIRRDGVNTSAAYSNDFNVMAEKYVMKFIPTSARIFMPKVYSLINSEIEIRRGERLVISARPLKDIVVELIFRTTRYLFYNLRGSISPIVPNNLREFFILVGLLASMEQIRNSRASGTKQVLESNKIKFKHYFFNEWKERVTVAATVDVQKRLDKLVNFDFGTSLNKEVIDILNEAFKPALKKDYDQPKMEDYDADSSESQGQDANGGSKAKDSSDVSASKRLIDSITSGSNFGYNVSVGDVFYLISNLEKETLKEEEYALLFFLKSFYSIKLYETYDLVTESEGQIYPPVSDDRQEYLSVIDHRFDFSNYLQQLVGGSYFTFREGDLIPLTGEKQSVDLRIVSGKILNNLLSALKSEIDSCSDAGYDTLMPEDRKRIDLFNKKLRLAEFFIFTIRCAVTWKVKTRTADITDAISRMRTNVDPFSYRRISPNTSYLVFDVMAPFANIVNPEYAYRRFTIIDDDFYSKIRRQEGSLLNKMIEATDRGYINHDDHPEWTNLHRLLSDSVIRNADVLITVKDGITLRRTTSHDGAYSTLLNFYEQIEESSLATHKTSDSDETNKIAFHFLRPLHDFLKTVISPRADEKYNVPEDDTEVISLFDSIFDFEFTPDKEKDRPVLDFEPLKRIAYRSRSAVEIHKRLTEDLSLSLYKNEIDQVFADDVRTRVVYPDFGKRNEKLEELRSLINDGPEAENTASTPPDTASPEAGDPDTHATAPGPSDE